MVSIRAYTPKIHHEAPAANPRQAPILEPHPRLQSCDFARFVFAVGLHAIDFSNCMTVNRIERIGRLRKYALPVATILQFSADGVPRDAVAMYDRYLVASRSHACVECRDNAAFNLAHGFIRVRHVVDCNSSAILSSSGSSFPRSFARRRIPTHLIADETAGRLFEVIASANVFRIIIV